MSRTGPIEPNPYAPPEVDIGEGGMEPEGPFDGFLGYAGFWRRAFALFLDYLIVLFLVGAGTTVITEVGRLLGGGFELPSTVFILVDMYSLAVPVAYFVGFESSRSQATPGKFALGIKVTDLQGRRIPIWHALGRSAAKIISAMILYLGFFLAGVTRQKQALHDMLAGTLVVRSR